MKRQVQHDRESHLGNFTKLALDIQRCEKYNPVLWGNVLKRSTKRLESFDNAFRARKPQKRARTPSSTPFPALTSTIPSLSEYLDQPDMVREMLQELNVSPMQRDQDTVNQIKQPEAQPRPAGLDPRSQQPQATNPTLKLPIIHVVTPRTRQHISRLPPPRESDLIAINQLENIADDAMAKKVHAIENLTRPNSLYGMLHRRAKSPTKTPRRAAIYSTKQIPDSRPPESIKPVKRVIPPTTELKFMKKGDVNVRLLQDEWTPMSQEDTDIAFPPLPRQSRAHYRNKTVARDHQNTIQQSYDVAIAKSDATRAVVSSIDAIKQWVPLELIYAHGRGGFASMHIEKAMQMVTGALRRLSSNQCRTAWKMWRDFCVQARTEEESRSALKIQCAWRQFRARCEANARREIRRRQHEREQYLLRRIASKREYAAKCIARSIRRYAAACVAYKERQRNQAAQHIQRFVRSRRAMWARFARFLEHQRCRRAAVRIQTCTREYLARAKVRLLRKLRAVALRAKAIEAVLEEKSHKMRLIGAALVVQRNVRRRRAARKAKFGAMRRCHAKKVKAAVKVQSIARMFLAKRLRRNMEAKYTKAAVKIQYAYRCYHGRKLRRESLAKRADAKKKRLAIKKEIRREKKRRQKAKENASQATKIWMTVQDAAKTIQTRPHLFQMTPERAALCIQGGWRGFKTRRRLKRQFAKERELERRRVNRLQKAAAMTIQRIVRGMLGRKLFWHTRLIRYVTSIQRLFRNRKARRDIALMQAYIKAAILIQKRWINKKEFVLFRKRRRAAVKIQSIGRMYIYRQAYWRRVQAHHVILETKIAGQVNFVSRTLGSIEAQLLQLSLQYPFDGKPNHSVQVMRRLYKRDPTTGQWSSSGAFGLWQVLFLDLCRYGNSMDATEIDNIRFSRFLKEIPGMLHKSLCPLQNVDIGFAKFKSPKCRTIPYSGFQKAMTYLLTLRYPDKAPVHYTMDQRFLFFVQQLLLVSKFGEQYRLKLTQWAMERSNWAAHVLQTMFRHHQHQMHHQEFVKRYIMMRRLEEEERAATLLQKKWRQRMAKLKFKSIVCDAFVEYVDWKSGARSYKNLITNTTTYGRPAILGELSPSVSIKMPPPGEEYLVYCLRHETKPADLATLYCLECEEAICSYCFERDHKRKAFADHASLPIFMCSLCSKQTASRTCNQCQDGHVPYCDTCYTHFHKNKNFNHTFVALVTLCVECGDKVGRWQCTTCTDFFCKKDFSAFHRKGQRQNHEMQAVSYLPLEAKAAQDRRLRDKELLEAEAVHDQEVSREVQQLELQKQEVAAIIIQTAYRGMRDRIAGKSYMKTIRYTNRMMQQRLKDDVIRSAFTYKLRKAVGFAPILASDTAEEVESILQRKEQITTALGLATYDYTKGVPPWCFYNAPVEILQGEFKSFRATIVSTNQVASSGVVMVHVTEANKSITLPLMHIKPLEETPSPSKVALVAQKVGTAAHKLQLNLLGRVEQKRLAIKLLHHRTEFKELEEYAWIEQRDDATGKTTWWNVVSNAKSGVKPKSLAALETMEPAEQEDLQAQIQEARDKIIKLHSRSDRGAGARRDSVDAAFDGQHVQAIHEALFWHDSLWSHPRVGKKARDLVKELNTDSLRSTVQLLSRANEAAGDDSAKWEKAVLKFCSLRTAEKKEILDETADMTSKDALAVLWNLVDPNAKTTNDQDDR